MGVNPSKWGMKFGRGEKWNPAAAAIIHPKADQSHSIVICAYWKTSLTAVQIKTVSFIWRRNSTYMPLVCMHRFSQIIQSNSSWTCRRRGRYRSRCIFFFFCSRRKIRREMINKHFKNGGTAAYQLGNTSSRTITEVKQCWARLVLGWETV